MYYVEELGMITKKDLESIPAINRKISHYTELLENVEYDVPDGLKGINYETDRVQTSNDNTQENLVINWIGRKQKLVRRIWNYRKKLVKKLNQAYDFIETIEDEFDSEIVERHCILGETFQEIGADTSYTRSAIAKRYYRCLEKYGVK